MIPGFRRSIGEGTCYSLQYSCISLVAQLVKNPPAMQETRDRSLGLEDVLEKGKTTLSSILASLQYSGLENSMACIVHGVTKSQIQLFIFT